MNGIWRERKLGFTRGMLLRGAGPGADPTEITTDTGEITSGRFIMARMPDGTSGQVLTAQGAGANPAYAATPGVTVGERALIFAGL